jgi:hypothetical protein
MGRNNRVVNQRNDGHDPYARSRYGFQRKDRAVPRSSVYIQAFVSQLVPIAVVNRITELVLQSPLLATKISEWKPNVALALIRSVVDNC